MTAATATATPLPATVTAIAAPSPTVSPTATTPPTVTPDTVATSRATPSATPGTPLRVATPRASTAGTPAQARPGPAVYPTQPRALGQPAAQTEHYRFYDPEGAHGATIALYLAEAEAIYAYVAGRTGLEASAPIPVVLQTQSPSDCAARGVAYRDGARVGIFVGPATPVEQLRMVLAHETVHILHFPYAAPDLDLTLGEGFANWASLRYWSEWKGVAHFDDEVRAYLVDGRYVPVDNPPADCTIVGRDIIYNERASFVGFLIDRYGMERFLAASDTSVRTARAGLPTVADYDAVYDASLAALIDEWLASLAQAR